MRLDKLLAHSGFGSRKQVKELIRKGLVLVNGEVIKNDDYHVDEESDEIFIDGFQVDYQEFFYIMLNKPSGVVSASFDKYDSTVVDLVSEYDFVKLFPVGRLDKDSEGLTLLTNDGKLCHNLISPKKKVEKEYYVKVKNKLNDEDIVKFKNGITLDDGYTCQSSILKILDDYIASVIIYEGKFHQVKRMFEALGNEVLNLKRVRIKNLWLDETLPLGGYRELSDEEIAKLKEEK